MTKKKIKGHFQTFAPFKVEMRRFETIGLHPGLDPNGATKKKIKLGPADYNPKDIACIRKCVDSPWTRKKNTEEFSENLGFRNASLLEERAYWNSKGGPGNYEISEDIFKRQTSSVIQNVGFGKQKRFYTLQKTNVPPPGTYTKNQTEPTLLKKQFTNLPPFEWDGFIDRLKDRTAPWIKAPNRYDPKDPGSIEALLVKKVSRRGPYDLFTGPRDATTIKNYFAPPAFKGPINFFYTFPSKFDVFLKHPLNKMKGKFLTEKRFGRVTQRHLLNDPGLCARDPNEPSPCSYDIETEANFKKNKYAFNRSVKYSRPPVNWKIHPSVGRYNPKDVACIAKTTKESWMFKSKIGRPEYKAPQYNAF